MPHRNTRQMLTAASPFVYLMMLFYFALTQYFSNRAHHQHSPPACSPLKKRENPLLSLYFSYKSTSDTHGNSQFSSRPPSLVSDPSGGCIHSAGPCLPSIMQSLMDSTEGRSCWTTESTTNPTSTSSSSLFSPHLCPRMNSCFVTEQAHTHK